MVQQATPTDGHAPGLLSLDAGLSAVTLKLGRISL